MNMKWECKFVYESEMSMWVRIWVCEFVYEYEMSMWVWVWIKLYL